MPTPDPHPREHPLPSITRPTRTRIRPGTGPAPRTDRPAGALTLLGLVLLALNLRAAITGVPPVLDTLRGAFHLTGTQVSVLTTLPVLCLGVFAPLTPLLVRRTGTEAALAAALTLTLAGALARTLPGPAALFTGTVLAGAGIAVGNVLMPAVVKRDFPDRIGAMTGLAMTLMAAGGALAAGLAVPLTHAAGWRMALAVWAVPALAAATVWTLLATRRHRRGRGDWPGTLTARRATPPAHVPAPVPPAQAPSVLRSPLAWAVAALLGIVSLVFYVLVAWTPQILRDQGYPAAEAGVMTSVMLTLGIPLGLAVPVAAARLADQRPLVTAVVLLKAAGLGGILLAPGYAWAWTGVLGVAIGAAFPLAMTLLGLRSADPRAAARLSAMAQTGGYLLAGCGPVAIGVLHTLTGTWHAPLLLLIALGVPELLVGLAAARPGLVGAR
ncbi:CynX/NimT family MFS transporter [Streptomyces sp. NPDC051452]|uniref:CynX/NimT family MFS transporter n=1 Tax=Streptomyces sp. NPDC051452 TaxID=3365654 RepID=UPI00378EFAD3